MVIFQSTLLQEERLIRDCTVMLHMVISIHAPTRGATNTDDACTDGLHISIHAPTRGATRLLVWWVSSSTYFNPRSYKRSDEYDGLDCLKTLISIHAPTRGATFAKHLIYQIVAISIHAPTRGATCSVMRKCSAPCYFNPRSYKRSDLSV